MTTLIWIRPVMRMTLFSYSDIIGEMERNLEPTRAIPHNQSVKGEIAMALRMQLQWKL